MQKNLIKTLTFLPIRVELSQFRKQERKGLKFKLHFYNYPEQIDNNTILYWQFGKRNFTEFIFSEITFSKMLWGATRE